MQHTQTCEVVGGKVKPLEVRVGTKETDVFQSMALGGEGGEGGRGGQRKEGRRRGRGMGRIVNLDNNQQFNFFSFQ